MPLVDHDRFDDVEFEFVEKPEPPRRRRRGVVAAGAVIIAGGLAVGATALASQDDPAPQKAKPAFQVRESHRGDWCRKGEGRHHRDKSYEQDTALRY
jgi:hypothetical protein